MHHFIMNLIFSVIFETLRRRGNQVLIQFEIFLHFYYISQLFFTIDNNSDAMSFLLPLAFSFSILPISSTIQKMTTTPKNYSAKIDFKIHKSFCTALTVFTHCEIRMHNQNSLGCVQSIGFSW